LREGRQLKALERRVRKKEVVRVAHELEVHHWLFLLASSVYESVQRVHLDLPTELSRLKEQKKRRSESDGQRKI
jgi:hypothetical protein